MEAGQSDKMKRTCTMTCGDYILSRITTLRPPMDRVTSPIKALRMLDREQWNFFGVSFRDTIPNRVFC